MAEAVKPARGRPRNLASRDAILRAARELLESSGPAAVTMEAVAERAGVGKPTVYRWWPNRHAVTMAALMEAPAPPRAGSRRTAPLRALEAQLSNVVTTLASRTGRHVTTMIAAADPDTEVAKAFRHHFVLARREEGRRMLEAARAEGSLPGTTPIDVLLDQIYGAIFFRLLLGHAPLDAAFVRSLLKGLAA